VPPHFATSSISLAGQILKKLTSAHLDMALILANVSLNLVNLEKYFLN
jgi:hypothetical protein